MEQVKQKNAYPSKGMSFADQKGLTKREYFAAMAMQGMLANNCIEPNISNVQYVTKLSCKAADELLKQLDL